MPATVTLPSFRRTFREKAERRLGIAVAASIAIHAALLLVHLRPAHMREATSPFGQGAHVLQAVLEQPKAIPEVAAPVMTVPEATDAPKLPPEPPKPVEPLPPAPVGANEAAPAPGPATALGTPDPPLSVTVGAVLDPARYGGRYARTLAEVFPDPVMREPQLRSSLVVVYPRAAVESRTRARIVAILTVSETGQVVDRKLLPEDTVFAPVVVEALKEAQFLPAEWDGRPVRHWAILEFVFSIDGSRAEVSPSLPASEERRNARAASGQRPGTRR